MAELHSKLKGLKVPGFVLLALFVVAVIAGGSWLTYSSLHQPATFTKRIPELGIQITVPESIKDLQYTVTTATLINGQPVVYASFSTTSLTQLDVGCSAEHGPLGSLGKASGQYPSSDPDAAESYGRLVKQFPSFYITSDSPQSVCSSMPAAQALSSEARSAFRAARSTIQPLN